MTKIRLLLLGFMLHIALFAVANEGMWIPTLLKKYNIEEMQKMGFRLTADDIYSINKKTYLVLAGFNRSILFSYMEAITRNT